jgi:hypothetical protein
MGSRLYRVACRSLAGFLGLATTLVAGPAGANARPERPIVETSAEDDDGERERRQTLRKRRRFMLGLEGVGLQAPALRPTVVSLDPRFTGSTVALGGMGVFGRYRPVPLVAVELGARSGSLRYRSADEPDIVAHDMVMFDVGTLLYLARGEVGQLALDAGVGGIYNRIGYEVGELGRSTQTYGSFFVRVGVDAEFVLKRIAIVLSLRSYGVLTDRDSANNSGPLLEGVTGEQAKAPVQAQQTYVAAAAGMAYRF